MFFDALSSIPEIATQTGFSVFVVPAPEAIEIPGATRITPEKNGQITKDQVNEIIKLCSMKETHPHYIILENAESLNQSAENAMLKLLEEPKNNYHIIFLVKEPSGLLKTVLSRARLYVLKQQNALDAPVSASPEVKMYAKKLITAKPSNLSLIMQQITSEKEFKKTKNSRPYVLKIVETAIEMLYKSYFQTKNTELIKKLPNFLLLYDNLKQNGHIKLHLVADLC